MSLRRSQITELLYHYFGSRSGTGDPIPLAADALCDLLKIPMTCRNGFVLTVGSRVKLLDGEPGTVCMLSSDGVYVDSRSVDQARWFNRKDVEVINDAECERERQETIADQLFTAGATSGIRP
jgi:hypothetical protein